MCDPLKKGEGYGDEEAEDDMGKLKLGVECRVDSCDVEGLRL